MERPHPLLAFAALAVTLGLTWALMSVVGPFLVMVPAWFATFGAGGSALFLVLLFGGLGAFVWVAERRHARRHYERTGEILVPPKAPKADGWTLATRWIIGGLIGFGLLVSALNGFK